MKFMLISSVQIFIDSLSKRLIVSTFIVFYPLKLIYFKIFVSFEMQIEPTTVQIQTRAQNYMGRIVKL